MEEIAKEAKFNNKPFFGAKKKRMKLMEEVCCIHTAIAIYAANCSFKLEECKPVIDGFLQILQKYMLGILEKHNPKFPDTYASRMQEYFGMFTEENPGIAISFAFLNHLHGKPQLDLEGQTVLAVRFSKAMSAGVNSMRAMSG